MERYLRPLAIAVVMVEVCVAAFTVPTFFAYLSLFRIPFLLELVTNPLASKALTITGLTLTFVLGIVAVIITFQRGHRPWSIAFAILLALFAYSPLFLTEVTQSPGFLTDSATFNLNTPTYTFVELSNHILPAIVLAAVVLVYSLRYRGISSQGHNAALEIERSKIDNAGASH